MRTIRERLFITLLPGLIVAIAVGGVAVYLISRGSLLNQLDAELVTRANSLAAMVTVEGHNLILSHDDASDELIQNTYFEIRFDSEELLIKSENLRDSSIQFEIENDISFQNVDLPRAVPGRAISIPFIPRSEELDPHDQEHEQDDLEQIIAAGVDGSETVIVTAAIDRQPVDRALATLVGAVVGVAWVLVLTVIVLVFVGVRWAMAPLQHLQRQIESVDGNLISQRFDAAHVPGELVPVYTELNRMLNRVEQTLERERSFADAAAHELRTPLSELRVIAEVAMKWPDQESTQSVLRDMLSISAEMERLVESLLLISRGNVMPSKEGLDKVPLNSIVSECLSNVIDQIHNKNLNVEVELESDKSMNAPVDAVKIIVRNLVDNAVQYTPSDGSISISNGNSENGSVVFAIENGPVDLKADDLIRLFEPFWRTESSRNDRQHVGLGLTVVEKFACAVGLQIKPKLKNGNLQICVLSVAADPQ